MNVGKLLLWTMIVHIAFKWELKETTNSSNIYGDDISLPSLLHEYIYIYIYIYFCGSGCESSNLVS